MQDGKLLLLLPISTCSWGRFFNSFDACVGPIALNPPASVHAGALATETVLSAPNCAIVPKMTSVRTQSQC